LEALEDRTVPSQVNLTVSSPANAGANTLRDAIQSANGHSPSDKVTIGFSITGTIDLQSPLPDLNNNIAIQGPGEANLTVERAAGYSFSSALVTVAQGQNASLSGLTIAHANAGALHVSFVSTVTVSDCTITGNSITAGEFIAGGGIYNAGTLTVSGCTITDNSAFEGGGISSAADGGLTIINSTLSGNSATDSGGAVFGGGRLTISGSTLSGNSASAGGGIDYDSGINGLTINDSILSGNSANEGGGIHNQGTASISGSKLFGNSANEGGGIYNGVFGTLTVSGSTLSGNSAFFGGGISNRGSLTVRDSLLTCNVATLEGGGIFNTIIVGFASTLTVTGSTLSGNSAGEGGAIYNDALATLAVHGSTLSCNTADDSGGAIFNLGTAKVQQSSLYRNSAGSAGGGIFNGASGTLAVKDGTVLHNVAPLGADLDNLGALTLDDSTVGVIGP
jgi:predicted outer membrane repeat protein